MAATTTLIRHPSPTQYYYYHYWILFLRYGFCMIYDDEDHEL